MTKSKAVLHVLPLKWMKDYLPKETPGITLHHLFDDHYQHLSGLEYNWQGYFSKALAYAKAHHIEAIIALNDRGSMLQAALNTHLNLPGISISAQFYCNNKYYGRTIEDHPIWFSYLNPADPDAINLRRIKKFPVIIKPVYSTASAWHRVAYNPQDVIEALHFFQKQGVIDEMQRLNAFYADQIGEANLPEPPSALKSIIVEALIHPDWTKVTYEAWVDQAGKQHPWCVGDEVYYPQTMTLNGYKFPSDLTAVKKETIAAFAADHMQKIINKGFINQFYALQFWLTPEGKFFITEVNPRAVALSTWLYQASYGVENYYYLNAKVAAGQEIGKTPWQMEKADDRTIKSSCEFYLTIYEPGKVSELIDTQLVDELIAHGLPVRQIKSYDDMILPTDVHAAGCCLLSFFLQGKSYHEIATEAEGIRRKMLRQAVPSNH